VGAVPKTLSEVERAVRDGWSRDSCDPVDLPWSAENRARGQCASTALVIQDLLGGELLIAEVLYPDGSRQGVHYWNRLLGGLEIDLTREQFTEGEVIQTARVTARPPDVSVGRLAGQYQALRDSARASLAGDAGAPA